MKIKANIRIKDDMYTVSLNWKIGTRAVNQKKNNQPAKSIEEILKCIADNIVIKWQWMLGCSSTCIWSKIRWELLQSFENCIPSYLWLRQRPRIRRLLRECLKIWRLIQKWVVRSITENFCKNEYQSQTTERWTRSTDKCHFVKGIYIDLDLQDRDVFNFIWY